MQAHHRPEAASFYHLDGALPRLCRGTACFVARHRDPERWRAAVAQDPAVYCLGKCHLAPAAIEDEAPPRVGARARETVLLERIVSGGAATLDRYGGYAALEQALRMPRAALIEAIEASGLRGRGGAGFPTGHKWRAVVAQPDPVRYVIANADEGDPGAYIDRILLEQDPHALIEGLAIAAHAVGASRGFLYLRREYPRAEDLLRAALAEAAPVLHRLSGLAIELVIGNGSYVCGEETSLLNAIEGKRPEVRARPPYPTERGLHGRPTLVQNVETLANVPWIVRRGAAAYAALGVGTSRGTKLVSLNSLFRRPGLYEVELGVPVRYIIEELGGGLAEGRLAGVLIGGPLAGILPPHLLDTPFAFEELRAQGASVGHGGVVAFDERTSVIELLRHVFEFGAFESCGKCTPCRLGSRRVVQILADTRARRESVDPTMREPAPRARRTGSPAADATPDTAGTSPGAAEVAQAVADTGPGATGAFDRARAGDGSDRPRELSDVIAALRLTSLCGLGTGLAELADSVARHYPEELYRWLA